MNSVKILSLIFSLFLVVFSCTTDSMENIERDANAELTTQGNGTNEQFFVSNIYKDKELGELYWKKPDGNIVQISEGKQNISDVVLNEQKNLLLYSQSQKVDKIAKALESVMVNGPSRFSEYVIYAYNLNNGAQNKLVDLSSRNITGAVESMGLLKDGDALAFQTTYGAIYLMDIDQPETLTRFAPTANLPNQFEFDDFYHMKTDGHEHLIFDARSGYKSATDSSYVYNKFKYNITTNQVEQVTDKPFYFESESE